MFWIKQEVVPLTLFFLLRLLMSSFLLKLLMATSIFCRISAFHIVLLITGVEVILLVLTGVSAGTDIYKQEVGCKLAVPELQSKVDELDRKHKELISFKDAINLAWVPG